LPSALAGELAAAAAGGAEIAALLDGGRPVAFCYAGSLTETLWDVSIDTLPAERRRGYAGQCAAWLIRRWAARGKAPVWQAVTDNPPSWRLALKLGFAPCAELVYFQAPEAERSPAA
ncbi:MAG TPA: GNAT family N-acetyltransferase, partial [Herpetosiphonaceae bacterium]